ncbi:glycosyltransferase [Aliifodinibius sp. S!AR15-10]|uniref:glycosyltransferase n=1 Tax=Aliifodinibius sp. S!AR15-10 TaxID=2950437 RepID=UPI0028616AE3|nr:glycosyltransferase [Aliifodinibius sp. S!AR15-10]MDR8393376.1 glycosyltransferase [Aliifodinibius sp. S!AR15-10]
MAFYYTVIDRKAKVLLLNNYEDLPEIAKGLSDLRYDIDIICGTWWTLEHIKRVIKVAYIYYSVNNKYDNINVIIACNTLKEYRYLKILGIEVLFCNQNCFVDENLFRICDKVDRKYKAIYNAVLKEWKRHYLCNEIENLGIVTYNFSNTEYKNRLDKSLDDPYWFNYNNGEPLFLNNEQLVKALNQAQVGLALSKEEGAMYASIEYLMCGLPVVSTSSKGGRDVFFNNKNSVIVEPTPSAVKEGVDYFLERDIDPYQIREVTLNKIHEHRERFISYVNKLIKKKGVSHDISDTWNQWFVHKLRHEGTINKIRRELE